MSLFGPQSTTTEEDQTPQESIITDSFTYPSSSLSVLPLADEEIDFSPLLYEDNSSDSSQMTTPQDDSNYEEEDETNSNKLIDVKKKKIRPTRLNILADRMLIRSQSSDRQQKRRRRNKTCSSSSTPSSGYATAAAAAVTLQKSMSCRSLGELELEEVKGFIDLGFSFKKENLNPRMMSLVPGLQRLAVTNNKKLQVNKDDSVEVAANKDDGDGVGNEVEVMRPYLSEAWLIKRPDSPLLNLKLPRVSAAADMKKHLKFWARTVASEIHQES